MANLKLSGKEFEPPHVGCYRVGLILLGLVVVLASGCASTRDPQTSTRRAFDFQRDTFAFANQLVWEYHYDAKSNWVSNPRVPKPDYSHHCFVVARSAKQFFEHARFDPTLPVADAATYRKLIHRVLATRACNELPDDEKVVIPGYADLREFSQAQEHLLKAECGSAWQSYFQRGHWRIIMPFTRHQQEKMANRLAAEIRANRPPIVHVICFPALSINHAIVLFGVSETADDIQFTAYDPNNPAKPAPLTFHRATRRFEYPANDYFYGGNVDIYEVYRGALY
ncbi:MAG TPA: hypothetical protein VN281_17225 [Verrucomicrobiae bacterium]|nr:hypothetical protein [Verrucomicrobiae bacterium]